ncbi:porin family protein [Psittacicella hinzii]|uniref:Porin n=1 Tax=Psittacicella hinzii TaxID=2028575 RepID=A0A3A1YKZ1_9GAMM|nr:hypothetical protein [Psittacicella hinzii]RIY37879.1 hypothetical protein CKF58_04545 [Psittacicella hinzii]
MKKSLLALALASIATTAFSATIYSSSYSNGSSAQLIFGGDFRAYYSELEFDKTDVATNTTTNSAFKRWQLRERVWLRGTWVDANKFSVSFAVRYNHSWNYNYNKNTKVGAHKKFGLVYNQGYLVLSKPEFGTLIYGKFVTVADSKTGGDTNTISAFSSSYRKTNFTAFSAATAYDTVITYITPKVNNFTLGLSYGKTQLSTEVKREQYALRADWSVGKNSVRFIAANTYLQNSNKVKGYKKPLRYHSGELSYTFRDGGLSATAALTAEKQRIVNSEFVQYKKQYGVAGKVKYVVNQYFQPYSGVGYIRVNNKYSNTANNVKRNILNAYVGVDSNVYKYKSIFVKVYAEAAAGRANERTLNTTSKTKYKVKDFAVGTYVSF